MNEKYVHGYSPRENQRLEDQAVTLTELLHSDTGYPQGSLVLEAGCGVGAQTLTLLEKSPGAYFISVDISPTSVEKARAKAGSTGYDNIEFRVADIFDLPFEPETFDHVFLCFVLEHISDPSKAIRQLRTVLKPGGSITAIEGDHGSTYFYPDSRSAHEAIQCLIDLQARSGGNSEIGRELYPLFIQAGLIDVQVSPRMVYVDNSRPHLVEGFTKKTFTAMIEGVRKKALSEGLTSEAAFDQGIRDLYRTAGPDGVFCYTFFKAVGINPT
ncbi:methyltransferase domain-containing protein [bacterium]|nr:methyltransferase domain-containing protein [bacterium]